MKISVDTNQDHLRNIVIQNFVTSVNSNPTIAVRAQLYSSGQLAKDRDVPKALHWGNIEMAVPAQSKLSRFVPDANLFTLPMLYGLPNNVFYKLIDGPAAVQLNKTIETTLGVKVLGKNIALGFTNIYTNDIAIQNSDQLKGLKIRVPGGSGPLKTLQILGASPVALPISDVPLALAQHNINGIQSTHETVASAKLWEVGINHCFEDRSTIILYTPIINQSFWQSLDHHTQQALQAAWGYAVKNAREFSIQRQLDARQKLVDAGVQCVSGIAKDLNNRRASMIKASDALAKLLGMDDVLLTALKKQVKDQNEH